MGLGLDSDSLGNHRALCSANWIVDEGAEALRMALDANKTLSNDSSSFNTLLRNTACIMKRRQWRWSGSFWPTIF